MKKKVLCCILTALMIFGTVAVNAEEVKTNLYDTYSTFIDVKDNSENVITYDQVLEKVKNYSSKIKTSSANVDLQEKKSEAYGTQYLYTSNFSTLSAMISYQQAFKSAKLSQESVEKSIEYSVLQAYIQIIMSERNIELSRLSLENDKLNLAITDKSYKLGLISSEDYENAKLAYETAKINYEKQVESLNKEYEALNTMMGVDLNTRYNFEYPAYYAKLELPVSIDTYAKANTTKAMSVQIKEIELDSAKESKSNYYISAGEGMASEVYKYDTLTNNVNSAQLALRDQKDSVNTDIRNLYTKIKQNEAALDKDIKQLETMKATLELAKTRYEMGLISQQELKKTEYNTAAKENSVLQSIYTHMLDVEKINNPSLF